MDEKLIEFAAVVTFVGLVPILVWFSFRKERAFTRELAQRALQAPAEFASFYSTPEEREIALRLLPIYSSFFGIEAGKLRPDDRPPEIVEIDTVELVLEIEAEFGVSIPDRAAEGLNGSFDSIVQYLVRNCPPTSESAA